MPSAAREMLLDLLAAAKEWNDAALNTPVSVANFQQAYETLLHNDTPAARLAELNAAKATSAAEDYDVIRADLVNRVGEAFMDFVSQSGAVTSFRNAAGRALAEDIPAAFTRGYQDAGGDVPEDDDDAWVTGKQSEQVAFMADAFESLKVTRENETMTEDGINARAELWGGMLDGVYAMGKLRGSANKMLTWYLGDTEKHCATCAKLDGQRHSAKWWIKHDYIPREPGSDTLDCKGYNCDCRLEDDNGDEFTVEQ